MTIKAAVGGDRPALRIALKLAAVALVADLGPSEQLSPFKLLGHASRSLVMTSDTAVITE